MATRAQSLQRKLQRSFAARALEQVVGAASCRQRHYLLGGVCSVQRNKVGAPKVCVMAYLPASQPITATQAPD